MIAVGRLDDPALAAEVVADGDADLVLLGRALIAEPDWPRKVEEGRFDELRPCIACNACVDLVGRGERARCSVNPEAGRELDVAASRRRPAPRRVMVVGSGPAGMEAARIARLRGHDVSIWERDAQLGGKLEVAGLAPSKREVLRFRDYQSRRLDELGVEIHLGAEVTPEVVARRGARRRRRRHGRRAAHPADPGHRRRERARRPGSLLRGDVAVAPGERVVVVGGSATGCETAEQLAGDGAEVTIVEMRRASATGSRRSPAGTCSASSSAAASRSSPSAKVIMIEDDHVLYEDADGATRTRSPADRVALAIGWRPARQRARRAARGAEVLVLGDASRPADFVAAINAGADAGLAV